MVAYRELQAALDGMGAATGAAEAHGWLCGALCARSGFAAADWVRELAQTAGLGATVTHSAEALRSVHEVTHESLRSPDFAFEPLLPGDEATLDERVAALAAWCGGFLYGFGTGSAGDPLAYSGDVREVLTDLAEIARARLEPGRSAEDGESDLAELTEFVRAAAQLAFDELAATRAGTAPSGAALH